MTRGARARRAPSISRRAVLGAGAACALAAAGCKEVPAGGVPTRPSGAPMSRRLQPTDVIPADLDLVVRVDVLGLKQTLGAPFERELTNRLSSDRVLSRAIERARTMTVGLRSADISSGDRVIVLEGEIGDLGLLQEGFEARPSNNEKVKILVRTSTGARDGTDAVAILDERAVALASPVETDAMLRVLREGPDEQRGQPVAEGIVSADIRARRLPSAFERRYPSVGRLIAQVNRIKVLLKVTGDGLRLDLEIIAFGDPGADRVRRFFDVLREGASSEGPTAILKTMKIEKLGAVVRITTNVRPEVFAAMIERPETRPDLRLEAPADPPPP